VASWVAEQCDRDQQVVVIFPDRGDRYCGTIYSPDFMREKGLHNEVAGAFPVPIRYGIDIAERWSYASVPHDEPSLYTGEVNTSGEIARELGLEAAHVS
jgi:cysteine synthase A